MQKSIWKNGRKERNNVLSDVERERIRRQQQQQAEKQMAETRNGVLGCLLIFLIIFMVVVSCFTPAPSKEQVEAITFTSDFKKSIRESWGAFDIIGTIVVICLCAAFYAYFW